MSLLLNEGKEIPLARVGNGREGSCQPRQCKAVQRADAANRTLHDALQGQQAPIYDAETSYRSRNGPDIPSTSCHGRTVKEIRNERIVQRTMVAFLR